MKCCFLFLLFWFASSLHAQSGKDFGLKLQDSLKNLLSQATTLQDQGSLSTLDSEMTLHSEMNPRCSNPLDIEIFPSFMNSTQKEAGIYLNLQSTYQGNTYSQSHSQVAAICQRGFLKCSDPFNQNTCESFKWILENQQLKAISSSENLGTCKCVAGECAQALAIAGDLEFKNQVSVDLMKSLKGALHSQKWASSEQSSLHTQNGWQISLPGWVESSEDPLESGQTATCKEERFINISPSPSILQIQGIHYAPGLSPRVSLTGSRRVYEIEVGQREGLFLSGNCQLHESIFDIVLPAGGMVKSAVFTEISYDDWGQAFVSGRHVGGDSPPSAAECETYITRRYYPNTNVTAEFQANRIRIHLKSWVAGLGNFYAKFRITLREALCQQSERITSSCESLETRPDWKLSQEIVDGVTIIDQFEKVNDIQRSCRNIPSACGNIQVCRDGWLTERKYFRTQKRESYECRDLPEYSYQNANELLEDGELARSSDNEGYYTLLEDLSDTQIRKCEKHRTFQISPLQHIFAAQSYSNHPALTGEVRYDSAHNQYQILLGKDAGNYLSGRCKRFWVGMFLQVLRPDLIDSVILQHATYDDWGSIWVNNREVDSKWKSGSDCDKGTRNRELNIDLTPDFKSGNVHIHLDLLVGGKGEGFVKIAVGLKEFMCKVEETFDSSCEELEEDPTWKLKHEITDGILTIDNFQFGNSWGFSWIYFV